MTREGSNGDETCGVCTLPEPAAAHVGPVREAFHGGEISAAVAGPVNGWAQDPTGRPVREVEGCGNFRFAF
jgi:hypothetical protein